VETEAGHSDPAKPMNGLRAIRRQRGLAVNELAARADIRPASVYNFEVRQEPPKWTQLRRLADVLVCTTDEILGRSTTVLATIDLIGRADRELLDRMEKSMHDIIGGPRIDAEWRRLAHMAFCGALCRIRDGKGLPVGPPRGPTPLPVVRDLQPYPKDYFTGWESDRQKAARMIEDSGKRRRQITAAKARV
jgi:transcriptional regulator with XRE-family HTH domain